MKRIDFEESLQDRMDNCYHCQGYYGPTNGDPLCGICHDFLYVEDFANSNTQENWGYGNNGVYQTVAEKDDGDSGNDEPSEDVPPIPTTPAEPNPPLLLVEVAGPSLDADVDRIHVVNNGPVVPIDLDPIVFPGEHGIGIHHFDMEVRPVNNDESPNEELFSGSYSPNSREQERIARRLALLTTPIPPYERVPQVDLTDKIPPEIWTMVFQKLDSVSLVLASRVCQNWKSIISEMLPNDVWKQLVKDKWPLFNPIYEVNDWYSVFVAFLDCLSCFSCWVKMHNPVVVRRPIPQCLRSVRLNRELKWLRADHPDGIEAVPVDKLNYNWLARILGPPKSPYEGGAFYLNIKIPHNYPLRPPVVRFLTKIYHPNVSRHGDIGIDCIQHNWTLAMFIPQTLLSIQSLLTDPCFEPCMEPLIAHHYLNDHKGFETKARQWTWKYAMIDVLII